jgi:hypothetical protein
MARVGLLHQDKILSEKLITNYKIVLRPFPEESNSRNQSLECLKPHKQE